MPTVVSSAIVASRQVLGRVLVRELGALAFRAADSARRVRLEGRVPVPMQRFGGQLRKRIAARWPALSEWLGVHVVEPTRCESAMASVETMTQKAPETPAALQKTLIEKLRDPNVDVAVAAALALGGYQDSASIQAWQDVLRNADGYLNPIMRVAALQMLAPRLAAAELAPVLDAVRDVDAEVSLAAIAVLVRYAPPHVAIEGLMPILADHTGFYLPMVRDAATRALERAGLASST